MTSLFSSQLETISSIAKDSSPIVLQRFDSTSPCDRHSPQESDVGTPTLGCFLSGQNLWLALHANRRGRIADLTRSRLAL